MYMVEKMEAFSSREEKMKKRKLDAIAKRDSEAVQVPCDDIFDV